MDIKYIIKLLPSATKIFTTLMGLVTIVILASYSFTILGKALGIGIAGGQVVCVVTFLFGYSLLIAHTEQELPSVSAESESESESEEVK